eukprot:CAMPEP_0114502702 /NCGR_PEP_ID=MMETSP0109-20121206/9244_1 /TAXON_ID=29199 /ORGANISM="Chlorarachnion reptans, Strain CCCM449" /LENGTH=48 /DNA_ID= /DNA_START= /DNA_END= /DNA_ORIENTATION=
MNERGEGKEGPPSKSTGGKENGKGGGEIKYDSEVAETHIKEGRQHASR